MDELGLAVLKAELNADCQILTEASVLARRRWAGGGEGDLEACAFQLARFYNIVEQMGLRIAKAFENNIDDEEGWHMELIRRLTLEIPGVRPPFFPPGMATDLKELRGFRHVIHHAYDLTLDKARVGQLVAYAERVAQSLPEVCEQFVQRVTKLVSD